MKKLNFVFALSVFCALFTLLSFAASVVYVDGVGTDENCYADLSSAITAVDVGGKVILKTSVTLGTSSKGLTLPAKAGEITVEGQTGSEVVTIARSLSLGGPLVLDKLVLHSTHSSLANVLCVGKKLTVGAGVTTTKASGAAWLGLFGGPSSGTVAYDTELDVRAGTYRCIYGASFSGTANGNSTVTVSNVTVTGTLSAGNYQGTFGGTGSLTVDLRGNKTVSAGTFKETPTVLVDEGYEAILSGGVYSQQASGYEPEPAPTTVYVDSTGATEGAYTSFADALTALSAEGGTVVVCGDTPLGTTAKGVVMSDCKTFTGKVTITGESGARLIFGRSLRVNTEIEFENIHIHSIIPSNLSAVNNINCWGNTITVGAGVTVTKDDGTIYPCIIGGRDANTTYDSHVNVYGGTWQNIYGGGYSGTFAGNSYVTVSGATVIGTLTAGSRSGSFTGTPSLVLDLRGGKTVTAGAFDADPTVLVDEGYEAAIVDGTYLERIPVVNLPRTVYVDGVGGGEDTYATLSAAVAEMPGGGTVILLCDVEIASATSLSETDPLTITSPAGHKLTISANLTLGGDTTFEDIILDKTASGNIYIVAKGHRLIIEDDVLCHNYSGSNSLSLLGGAYSGAFAGDTYIEVKAGFFRNIYGGNYNGAFTGNTYIKMSGGRVNNSIVGGNYTGNFTGSTEIILCGDGEYVYNGSGIGVVGASVGSTSTATAYTFNGNTSVTVKDDFAVCGIIFGGPRYKNVTMHGDTAITLRDNAFAYLTVYGSGYYGHDGNVTMNILGGETAGNVVGGAYNGDVTGNVTVNLLGGRLCRQNVNDFSAASDPAGSRNVYAGSMTGTVGGSAAVLLDGAEVYGNIYGGNITLRSGDVYCAPQGDIVNVEIPAGKTLSLQAPATLTTLGGEGKLVLAPESYLTVGTLSGTLSFEVNGKVLPANYITATSVAAGATLTYLPQDDDFMTQSGNTFALDFPNSYKSVTFTVYYSEGCTSRLRLRGATSGATLSPVSETSVSATYTLTPGLYRDTVVYTADNSDYNRKSVYIDGRSPSVEIHMEFERRSTTGFGATPAAYHTDQVLDGYFDENDITGYFTPDTPYFNKRGASSNIFTTNAEIVEFLAEKAENCPYLYVFNLAISPSGYQVPLALFTLDEIPAGATLAEAAAIVSADKTRDILMVTGGIHGNEPTGSEGTLAFISELCTAYGQSVLDGTNLGAILVIPRQNPEGFYTQTRETALPNPVDNLNRDFMLLSSDEIAGVSKVYQLFLPTLTVDCHEASSGPIYSDGDLLTDVYDIGIMNTANAASPLADGKGMIAGDADAMFRYGDTVNTRVLQKLQAIGGRTYYYPKSVSGVYGNSNCGSGGALSYTVEVPGIAGGNTFIARRTFMQLSALKSFVAVILEDNGDIAALCNAARAELLRAAQIYDPEEPVVLDHQRHRVTKDAIVWNNLLVAMDGTVRVSDNPTYLYSYSNPVRYRSRPTGYVFPADLAQLDIVLSTLDRQGIPYLRLENGVTMQLHGYTGSASAAYRAPTASAVSFANGAYLVPVDGYRAAITALLFEPDCSDFSNFATLTQMDYIPIGSLYATTENFVAAKHGMDGTYLALDLPLGRTATAAVVDGAAYDSVANEDGQAFVLAAQGKEYYTVTLTLDDASEKVYTVGIMPGDASGDGEVTILDALLTLRTMLNKTAYQRAMDYNGDGKISLSDILGILKLIAN